MDLVRVETHNEVVYSFLSVGWGFIADIDIESERLRMLGSPRFTIWSIARLIGKTFNLVYQFGKTYIIFSNQSHNVYCRTKELPCSVVILQNQQFRN